MVVKRVADDVGGGVRFVVVSTSSAAAGGANLRKELERLQPADVLIGRRGFPDFAAATTAKAVAATRKCHLRVRAGNLRTVVLGKIALSPVLGEYTWVLDEDT